MGAAHPPLLLAIACRRIVEGVRCSAGVNGKDGSGT